MTPADRATAPLAAAVQNRRSARDMAAEARADHSRRNPKSRAAHGEAARHMPGGNTRTVLFYEPFPLVMRRGEGARLWDVDGHAYVDLLGEFTAGLFGHSHPEIRRAIEQALDGGINLGAHTLPEVEMAELVHARFPSMERLRFTNSGTEANLMALAAATCFTGRVEVMVFAGAYHGGVLTFGKAASPANVPHPFVVAPYNDADAAAALIRSRVGTLAAVLVEPMLGSGGCIPGDPAFLAALREATADTGALLIFDEVMTSRLSEGGRQQLLRICPDLTTLGKYFGGGLSFGAFGGRLDVMAQFDPSRPGALGHAGTFNNNVLSMSAGVAGLRIYDAAAAAALNRRGDGLRERLNAIFAEEGLKLCCTGLGSIMNIHPVAEQPRSPADLADADGDMRDLVFFDLLDDGFYVARRGLISLSLALEDDDVLAFEEAVRGRAERWREATG